MDKYEQRDRIRGQVRTLEQFFKNYQTWDITNVGAWLVTGIIAPIATILLWVPYQELGGAEKSLCIVAAYLLWLGLHMYLYPYLTLNENRSRKSVADKLRYHPVDRRSIRRFLLKKLFRMLLLMGVIQLAGQCVAALVCYGRIGIGNILYPILTGVGYPGAINALSLCLFTKN